MGEDFSYLRFGSMALHLFGMILISLSIITFAILSCGEYEDSNRPRRREGGHNSGGGAECCIGD
ncbi:hypothetical protein Fmac_019204 [Flemingia macrophylla]|uniref:Transmembrane protein n=1 Tax=Flemingia macrophylla TaxID=520843 RepID=A0ABD1M7U1_9FABA